VSRSVFILGSTGSIGRSTLDVVEHLGGRFEVVGLTAGRRVDLLAAQIRRFGPRFVSVADNGSAERLSGLLGPGARDLAVGPQETARQIRESGAEVVVSAIVGSAGLVPTLAAVETAQIVALANKESLVVGGEILVGLARENGTRILPIDSEHNAIHQCLRAGERSELRRIVLTASGGPFRGRGADELEQVRPEDALAHPTWEMGRKITIDSATLMNKGLEVIEAAWLFDLEPHQIDVVIHPQSVVHSMVEFLDGSVVAQMGVPDMRHPIQYALTWPERHEASVDRLDLAALGSLTFERPDTQAFPCLDLAYRALATRGDAPARLNAANEVAVEAFLAGRLRFTDIAEVIRTVLDEGVASRVSGIDQLLEIDRASRKHARSVIERELLRR
jgi:1-deoxy-D-xylulose-5-phosphate reductoisomerase